MKLLLRATVLLAALLASAFTVVPWAAADPTGTEVSQVFQLPCATEVCKTGTRDRILADGALARGRVQIQVASSSSVGLDWVRLERRVQDGVWACLAEWQTNATVFTGHYDWDTTSRSGGCADSPPPGPAPNGSYWFQVIAHEKISGESDTSLEREVRANNRPATPVWSAEPNVTGAERRAPRVELRWEANIEPDIVEYHFVRSAPDGDELEFAVSAASPEAQGCAREGTVYVCRDAAFPAAEYGGSYEYLVIAYRSSPSSADSCAIPPVRSCVQSLPSDVKTASVFEPPPPPEPERVAAPATAPVAPAGQRRTKASGSTRSDNDDFFTGTYEKELPFNQVLVPARKGKRPVLAAGEPLAAGPLADDRSDDRPLVPVAGGLVLLLVAVHAGRFLHRHGS